MAGQVLNCTLGKQNCKKFEHYFFWMWLQHLTTTLADLISERDSLKVSALACHAADPGSNPAQGDDFVN